jgi:hypothetical protein
MNELAFSTSNRRSALDCQANQRTRATATRTTARGSTMIENIATIIGLLCAGAVSVMVILAVVIAMSIEE